ncbi:glycosyltransferase [Marinilactibacillus psychrotolerans]|uniref:glycosyltransferase n=1 Tax=Marinilactibacillus psychrotolerans TaxID=191770 RepID=UPI0037FF41F9
MKIGIVILNYLNWKDTVDCVETIFNQSKKDLEIVIVDNHSQNESISELSKLYEDISNITILENSENMGFAKGNNAGIKYCKENLGLYNVFVCNNDVLFEDTTFFSKLTELNFDNDIGAIGTTIIGADGKNQNPVKLKINTYTLIKHLIEPILNEIGLKKLTVFMHQVAQFIKKKTQKKAPLSEYSSTVSKNDEEYFLHGAAIYFTEAYLKKADGFYPETFLYYEENILGIVFEKMNLKMLYIEDLKMNHKEDQSMALSFSNISKAKKRLLRRSIMIAIKVRFYSIGQIKKKFKDTKYKFKLINN